MAVSSRIRVIEDAIVWPTDVMYIPVGHVEYISRATISCRSKLSTSHICRSESSLAVEDFTIKPDVV